MLSSLKMQRCAMINFDFFMSLLFKMSNPDNHVKLIFQQVRNTFSVFLQQPLKTRKLICSLLPCFHLLQGCGEEYIVVKKNPLSGKRISWCTILTFSVLVSHQWRFQEYLFSFFSMFCDVDGQKHRVDFEATVEEGFDERAFSL